MNIFVTSPDPIECAKYLDNSRIGKMLLESCQLLCAAVLYHHPEIKGLYKLTHKNHPCAVWTRQTNGNFQWLRRHAKALADEFIVRFGHPHACEKMLGIVSQYDWCIPRGKQTPFANCAAHSEYKLNFKHLPVHEAYKLYLNKRWKLQKRQPIWR